MELHPTIVSSIQLYKSRYFLRLEFLLAFNFRISSDYILFLKRTITYSKLYLELPNFRELIKKTFGFKSHLNVVTSSDLMSQLDLLILIGIARCAGRYKNDSMSHLARSFIISCIIKLSSFYIFYTTMEKTNYFIRA